jgi:hypothetical protein
VLLIRTQGFFTPESGIRDGRKIRIRDEHPRYFSESLETDFRAKILKLFYADPGSGIFLTPLSAGIRDGKIQIRDNYPVSTTPH